MKIDWKWLMDQIREAEEVPGIVAIPLSEFDVDDLTRLAGAASERGIGITIWQEHSNFSQDALVELQRYRDRYYDPTKPHITYKNQHFEEGTLCTEH